jgi:hypothetical protein
MRRERLNAAHVIEFERHQRSGPVLRQAARTVFFGTAESVTVPAALTVAG